MTFESMNPVAPTTASNTGSYPVLPGSAPLSPASAIPSPQGTPLQATNEVAVKAFFGNDIRRASFNGGYATLHEVCTKVYGIDPATIVLKYHDEDGDKVTMSTDAELQEALKLSQDKVLRVYVELKGAPAVAQEEAWGNRSRYGPMRGHHRGGFGFGGYGGFGRRGFHHGPHAHHGPHPHPHGFFGGPHAHGFPHPPHGFPHPPQEGPHADPTVQTAQHDGGNVNYTTTRVHAHGTFSPAGDPMMSHCKGARADASPYPRGDWKERKQAMKEHFKYMKENNVMDKDEFRELRQQMKEQMAVECMMDKEERYAAKEQKKAAKEQMKAIKRAAKAEKYGKKDKKDKKEKEERLMARHVTDVTIPDNCELPANTPVTKTWRLRNDGALAWPADSQLTFLTKRGDSLNGPERVLVGPVEPQKEVDVSMNFVTPIEPGRFIGYYRMATGDGRKFGQRVWVSFIIAQGPATKAENAGLDVNME